MARNSKVAWFFFGNKKICIVTELALPYTDGELVGLIKQNNRKGFDCLYGKYAAALCYTIGKIVKDGHSGEDILQDTFVNIWNNIHAYDCQKGTLYTWMRNIARNKAIDFARSGLHQLRAKSRPPEDGMHAVPRYCHEAIDITSQVNKLQPKYLKIIQLVYSNGHTPKEVSDWLDIPIGTVKTRLRNALKTLRFQYL